LTVVGGRWLAGQAQAVAGQDAVHRGGRDPYPLEVGTTVGQLAVRQINRTPVFEQLQHRSLFPRQDAVDRMAAWRRVVETAREAAALPAPGSLPIQLQHAADP